VLIDPPDGFAPTGTGWRMPAPTRRICTSTRIYSIGRARTPPRSKEFE
jgi:hypothetical protein